MTIIPDNFARTIVELEGAEGEAWLKGLPALIAECEHRWSLRVGPPFELSYNYVAPAVRADGAEVVLKLGFPNPELRREIAALRHYNGDGVAQMLESDADQCAFVLERLRPGVMLATLPDDEAATAIAAQVMKQLWRPLPPAHSFHSVAEWAAGLRGLREMFGGGAGPLPRPLVEQAESHFAELLGSMTHLVLLHGDLHHYNILSAERQPWLAIDPKGMVGEPEYEVGPLLLNPFHLLEMPKPARVLERRIFQLAELLGFDRQRLRAWGVAQAVLSAWWSIEDHGYGWEGAVACAELLAGLKV
uniref:Aminoglycoside/hydroxyurea antibiotic resistance kinase n=1 Tax=uncultured Chloroflexi bacterium Rifle_16ft_4_minimus_6153 TaxID=1665079 RepID=A0A0H4TUK2_9CHLR|nr:aminoglycoside/hydroxyurea antibiotic resistance kinase [uncultured Chloroflexi bacterium Rifle_16ft_4_minimus_6153]